MQLEIVYFNYKGFIGYILSHIFFTKMIGVAVWLPSSGSFFYVSKRAYKINKAYLFASKFNVVETHKINVDYDIYVKIVQACLYKAGFKYNEKKNWTLSVMSGAPVVYDVVIAALKQDRDYTYINELNPKEISQLTPKKLYGIFSSIISKITV